MAINPVGYVGCYNATNFKGGKVDPQHDKVYIDPTTGRKTTWKPGLYDPEAQEKTERSKKVLKYCALGLFGGALAFLFRGKIKGAIDVIKGLFTK